MAKRKTTKRTPKKRTTSKKPSTKKRPATKKPATKKKVKSKKRTVTKTKAKTKKKAAATRKKSVPKKTSPKRTKASSPVEAKAPTSPKPAEPIESDAPKAPRKRNHKPMSESDKKKYTEILLTLSDKITGRIKFLSKSSLNKEGYDIPPDTGTEDFERDFALTLLSSEQDVVFEIDQALRRIKDGNYGICETCDKKILITRLRAVPFARMCIGCQSEAEKTRPAFRPFGQTLMATEPKSATSSRRSSSTE